MKWEKLQGGPGVGSQVWMQGTMTLSSWSVSRSPGRGVHAGKTLGLGSGSQTGQGPELSRFLTVHRTKRPRGGYPETECWGCLCPLRQMQRDFGC